MSDTIGVWFLLIDRHYTPLGSLDKVTVPLTIDIADLKTRIQEKTQSLPAYLLTIFRCTDSSIDLLKDDEDEAAGNEGMVLNSVRKMFSNKEVKKLRLDQTIASLQLRRNDTLIVQVPGSLYATSICSVLKCFAITDIPQRNDDDNGDNSVGLLSLPSSQSSPCVSLLDSDPL
jgi:hypothetical protein